MINPLRLILTPFAWLYDAVTRVRNRLFDLRLKPSTEFDVSVIAVGNLSVGGTGKTPMAEYLLRLLLHEGRVAFISRGYGRGTHGFRIASQKDSAYTIGDEPYQVFRKFSPDSVVAVGEERALAIAQVIHEFQDVKAVLLDDAFQHRSVRPRLSILLTTYHRPFYNDVLLPAGRLRESRVGARRADVIVVTKCPALSDDDLARTTGRIAQYSAAPVFFTRLQFGRPQPIGTNVGAVLQKIILVTGIADAQPLEAHLREKFEVLFHFRFPDHHRFRGTDLQRIMKSFRESGAEGIFTTEKDAMRLIRPEFSAFVDAAPWYFVPVEPVFVKNGEDFDAIVRRAVVP